MKNYLRLLILFSPLMIGIVYGQNIGVGTNTPQEKLHISGTLRVDDLQTSAPATTTTDKVVWVDANGKVYSFPAGSAGKILGVNGAGLLAWLDPGLANTLNNGQIWIGDATNTPVAQTASGDALIDNAGVITVQDNAVDGTDISISAESNGSLMYFDGTNWVNLGVGTAGQILSISGGVPTWINPAAAPTTGDLTTTTTGITVTGGTGAVLGAGTTVNIATNALGQNGLVTGPTIANPLEVWGTDALGNPSWVAISSLLTTRNVLAGAGNNAVSITNGTNQVVGATDLTVNVATNALNQAGVVTGTTGANANQVWGTDALGNPAWITPANNDWHLTGNTGTSAATNFIGTTDNVDFVTRTNNIQRTRIINDGRMKIGSGANFAYGLSRLEIEGEGLQPHISYVSDYPSFIMMRHNGTIAAPTSLANGENVGELRWYGHNGTTYMQTARILSYVDGAPTLNSVPGNLRFMTNTAGNNLTDEKMIIKNNGDVGIGTASIGSPLAKLHVFSTGGNWNLVGTNGDFYVGDATYRFKLGVATGGGGAGDVYLNSNGGTNRIFMGGGTNTQILTINGTDNNMGININGAIPINSRLDINGDLALREGTAIAVAAGANALTLTGENSHYRLTGAAAAFAINTIAGGNDGQLLTLINATGQAMTINNNNSANGILTGTNANIVLSNANSSASLIYNATLARWVVKSTSGAVGGNDWTTLGNASTNPATNFVGTTDNVDFVTRTNNTEVMRATNAQRIGIGVTAPTTKLEVNSGTGDAIYGHSNNIGGYLGYETNFTFGSPAQNILGAGVWASNPAAGYTSLYAQSTGAATVAAAINYSNVWMASYNLVDNASTFNPSALYSQLNVTNATLGGTQIALRGYNNRGTTAGNPGYTVGVQGISDAQNQDAIGVEGVSYTNAPVSIGGFFEGLNYAGTSWAYAYVGGTTNGATARKIVGTGTVSEIVPTPNHGRVTLTCPESPEYWYQDYGTVAFVEGFAHVELDPILVEIIMSDEKNPIRVFPTPVDMPEFNGVTVTNRTATGFDLVELNGGKHSGSIDYQIVVKPKTNYGEGRFPQAPGPAWLKADKEPQAAKAANQPKKENVFHWQADHEVYNYNPEDFTPVGDMVRAGKYAGMYKLGDGTYSRNLPVNKDALKISATSK